MAPLIRQRRVVDDERRHGPADQGVSRPGEHLLEGCSVPRRGGDEVAQLPRVAGSDVLGHRLDALRMLGPEEPFQVLRRPVPLLDRAECLEERRELLEEIVHPV